MTDILIRGGTVLDGSGEPGRLADVLVRDGRIAAVGPIEPPPGADLIEAEGLVVAPGFIDIHSHSDYTLLVDPRGISAIAQGVTLEVVGNCGYGCAPVLDGRLASLAIYGAPSGYTPAWRSTADYLSRLEAAQPAVNVLTLVPNGQLRLGTVGLAQRPADAGELDQMCRHLRDALEEGAWGLSTGLEYAHEAGATEAEVTALCRELKPVDGLYATHTRDRDTGAVEAVAEAVRIADAAGCRLQVSHLTPRADLDMTRRAIDVVDRACRDGVDAAFDMHTRRFGFTNLKNLLPLDAFDGGRDSLAARLADPAERRRFAGHRSLITALGDWERICLLDADGQPDLHGLSFAEIGRRRGKPPIDCAFDVLLAEVDQLLRPMVLLDCYSEEMLRETYRDPRCLIGSDATTLAPDGPFAGQVFHGAYTWAAWFWRRMVRETGTFTPEAAVHKLARLPAERIGLADRGRIDVSAAADIAVFDPARFGERGTMERPSVTATGMAHVLVNGVVALRAGRPTGNRAGRVLRRSQS